MVQEMDPNRSLDIVASGQSVDWCDMTIYTGNRFHSKGRLEIKL